MKPLLIVPVTKGPHPTGRIGPQHLQDWWRGLVIARRLLNLARKEREVMIYIVSDVQVAGEDHEVDLYIEALLSMGDYKTMELSCVRKCQETICQINHVLEYAERNNAEVIFVSTWLHYPRVRWLTWRANASMNVKCWHKVVFGIPRPKEALTDFVLIFLFPVIDLMGKREWFLRKIERRRLSGVH